MDGGGKEGEGEGRGRTEEGRGGRKSIKTDCGIIIGSGYVFKGKTYIN